MMPTVAMVTAGVNRLGKAMPRQDTDQDERAIRAVISKDTRSYLSRDIQGWSECFLHSDRMLSIMAQADRGLLVHRGFDEFSEGMRKSMATEPAAASSQFQHENFQITVIGDMAWATYDQSVNRSGDPIDPPAITQELRILERLDGQWRIVAHIVFEPRRSSATGPLVEVEADGTVVWINDAAKDRIGDFGGLTISAGRLRGARASWDKALRAGLAGAAELLNYAAYNARYEGLARIPVVLGDDEEGALRVCVISVQDFRIYVAFDDRDALKRKLEQAAIVFAISPAQLQVAVEIAQGRDLPGIADTLGVSVTTVRTHLRRMFEKTGTHGQPALMRLLLSVGS